MSGRKNKAPLRALPPRADYDRFVEGAGREDSPAPAPDNEQSAPSKPASGLPVAAPPDAPPAGGSGGQRVRFILRLQPEHHEMLAWLSERSREGGRKRSMQEIALEMLEPALEEAVRQRREELGV